MNFDGLFDEVASDELQTYDSGVVPRTSRLPTNPAFRSPGALSLALQSNADGKGEMSKFEAFNGGGGDAELTMMRNREDENESRSGGSDNLECGSGDDVDGDNPRKRKRYHRHTPQQIQELEGLFKECPHPDEKQRMELSRRLNLDQRQVKFWFQNRRTQMKTQIERHENSILRAENDKLRAENITIREAMRSPACGNCGGPAMLGEVSPEEQHLRIENARLKDELDRVCGLASRFLGRPMSAPSFSHSPLDLGISSGGFPATGGCDFTAGSSNPQPPHSSFPGAERSMLLELALAAMDELVKLAQLEAPLWIPDDHSGEVLNLEEYSRAFHRCVDPKPVEFISEATRETGIVLMDGLTVVDSFMDASRWAKLFPCIVAKAATVDIISAGMGGTPNGALQLMQAELQVLTPLVPVREVSFLRFCKQHAEGVWAVVDVSVDAGNRESFSAAAGRMSCRRLPSGFLLQAMSGDYSKVTWVEHVEYDETAVHRLYRPPLRAGIGLGARRWLPALQRQSEWLAVMTSSSPPPSDNPTVVTVAGRRSMIRLAGRMTENFCAGVCAWPEMRWREGRSVAVGDDVVRVMTRQSADNPGEPSGVVLSAATSVWLPAVSPPRLFQFLRDERLRCEWDILSNGGPMQEVAHIGNGRDYGNAVSVLRATVSATAASATDSIGNQKQEEEGILILQETSTDGVGSLVVYAPVDAAGIDLVMSGGDSSYVALLPSGFAILPDCTRGGSLLTIAFQILLTTLSTAELTAQLVDTVKSLFSCTVLKIKSALNCDG